MKLCKMFMIIQMLVVMLFVSGCCRTRDDVWEDTKSAGRHMSRGFRSLGGKHGDSRQVCSREEFMCYNDDDLDYIPLYDEEKEPEIAMTETKFRQPKESPGDRKSTIPGIDAFSDPERDPQLAEIFAHIHFPYDSNLIKGQENLDVVRGIANYLKNNPNVYVFVEGHCDERGAQAYNLALGSRRANSIRNLLIKEGVSPDNIFTVSYGKERPVAFGHAEQSWKLNRRGQFKIFNRS